jgi:hypothetical protein
LFSKHYLEYVENQAFFADLGKWPDRGAVGWCLASIGKGSAGVGNILASFGRSVATIWPPGSEI